MSKTEKKQLSEKEILEVGVKRAFPDSWETILPDVRKGISAIGKAPLNKKQVAILMAGKRDEITQLVEEMAHAPLLGIYLATALSYRAGRALAAVAKATYERAQATAQAKAKKIGGNTKAVWSFRSDSEKKYNPFEALKGVITE